MRFSFTDFQSCSMATTVMLLARVKTRDCTYDKKIEFGMKCLQNMSIGNNAAIAGLKYVEALRTISLEAVTKLDSISSPPSFSTTRKHYDEWTNWLQSTEQEIAGAEGTVTEEDRMTDTGSGLIHQPRRDIEAIHMSEESPYAPFTSFAQNVPQESLPQSHLPSTSGSIFASHNDDQTFFLELTGLESILDFSNFDNES